VSGVVALALLGAIAQATDDPGRTSATATSSTPSSNSTSPTPSEEAEFGFPLPDLVGMTITEAERAIQQAGRYSDVGDLTFDVEVTVSKDGEGLVESTEPPAGAEIGDGATITLIIALAPMPDLVGDKAGPAAANLRRLGYKVTVKGEIADSGWGKVLSQSPKPGTAILPGEDRIVLVEARPQPGLFISVTGTGSALITWIDGDFSTHQVTVSLPYTRKVPYGGTISMSAQRQLGDGGSITCAIIDTGEVVKKSTSSGPYSICSVVY
jgi:hypothetical protein